MKQLIRLALGAAVLMAAAIAQAVPVVTLSATGLTTTSVAGATVIDFNSGLCGYATCSGDYQIVLGTTSQHAQPAGTNTKYLAVPNPVSNGSAMFKLGTNADYFGLYWGSIDNYNSISFYLAGSLVASYTGTQIVGASYANGNRVSLNSNRYINFAFGTDLFDSVKLTSTQFAFESDNHAYRAVAKVPEPSALLLFLAGFMGLIAVRVRSR